LWLDSAEGDSDAQQIVRFNEAVDQLIAESVARYSGKLDSDADVFTASIGHDLRNPLNAIAMSAQLLKTSDTLHESEKNAVDQIHLSAVRMGAMLGELQGFSRVRLSGMLRFERQQLDVAHLCEEVVREIRASTPRCQINFSHRGETTASVGGERIGQMLSNLIGNAVQHGEPGASVDIDVAGHDEAVTIRVRNAGPEIPSAALARIFDPLYRTDSTVHENRMHLGLGLYIARTIARAHGGEITVTSEDGSTTFEVRLPREPPAPAVLRRDTAND
jgi:signal transduction histidine kinase